MGLRFGKTAKPPPPFDMNMYRSSGGSWMGT